MPDYSVSQIEMVIRDNIEDAGVRMCWHSICISRLQLSVLGTIT